MELKKNAHLRYALYEPECIRFANTFVSLFVGSQTLMKNMYIELCSPLFISPNGHIFLETFGDRRLYHTAYDFLIAVAEVCGMNERHLVIEYTTQGVQNGEM